MRAMLLDHVSGLENCILLFKTGLASGYSFSNLPETPRLIKVCTDQTDALPPSRSFDYVPFLASKLCSSEVLGAAGWWWWQGARAPGLPSPAPLICGIYWAGEQACICGKDSSLTPL